MTTMPFEIVEDILRRLPVKTLKRFRAVAKSWCFLIDSERFARLHLGHTLVSGSHRHLILGGLGLYRIDLDLLDEAYGMKPPFYYRSSDGVSNACNGVVLVMSEPPVLWNPFAANYRVLPDCGAAELPTDSDLYSRATFGFGYDAKNDEYKVVRVTEFRNKLTHMWVHSETKIYGHRSNCWRTIDGFPYPLPFLRGHWRVHVNGALHTLVEPDLVGESRIMAFSVEAENHYELMMPPGIGSRNIDLNLDMFDGCLAAVCARSRSRVVIWVMKEYGVKESWTKLLTVGYPAIEKDDFVKPLVYSRDGNKVLLNCDDKRLVWYDLRSNTVENVSVEGMPFMFYAEFSMESLISFDCPVEAKKLVHKKPKQSQEKRKEKKIKNKRDDFLSEGFKLVL